MLAARNLETRMPMPSLRDLILSNPPLALALIGLAVGFLFGVIASAANFCVMGAVSDWRTFGDKNRLGTVALAATTAIAITQYLHGSGTIDISRSMYLGHRINWAGAILGGLMFGYGMVRAGGCASRHLIRAGGGDLRALVTLIFLSVAASATLSGIFGPLRNGLDMASAIETARLGLTGQSLAEAAGKFGLSAHVSRLAASLLLALPLVWFAVSKGRILQHPLNILAGIAIGLLVAAGWLATGLAYDEMAVRPVTPTSLSFVKPVGDAIDWLQHSTALGWPSFAAATVFGVLAGSFAFAFARGRFVISSFASGDDLVRHLSGAAMMGAGGVLGLGCSIGQGITGLSTLAIQSVMTSAAIIFGAVLALSRLERQL